MFYGVSRMSKLLGTKSENEVDVIYKDLTEFDNYMNTDLPTSMNFTKAKYTFFGMANNQYIFKIKEMNNYLQLVKYL